MPHYAILGSSVSPSTDTQWYLSTIPLKIMSRVHTLSRNYCRTASSLVDELGLLDFFVRLRRPHFLLIFRFVWAVAFLNPPFQGLSRRFYVCYWWFIIHVTFENLNYTLLCLVGQNIFHEDHDNHYLCWMEWWVDFILNQVFFYLVSYC